MCGPGRSLRVVHRRVKALWHTVSELKHGNERESQHAAASHVEEKNPVSGLKQKIRSSAHVTKTLLPMTSPTTAPRDRGMFWDPMRPCRNAAKIVVPVPLERQEAIRGPQIYVLISVHGSPFLQRAQTTKAAQINILVHP